MYVRLLGRLEVERDGTVVPLPRSRKTRALLGYLAAQGTEQERSWLCDLLWDGPADPRAALRWSLAKIRPLVDEPGRRRLVTRSDSVGLELGAEELDLDRLEAIAGPDPASAGTDDLRNAATLFRGSFLEGLELDGCHRFDAWLTGRREELRRVHRRILTVLIDRLKGSPEEALAIALQRLGADPYLEENYVDTARLLLDLARPEEAREQLERARAMLEQVLGVEPSPELVALDRKARKYAARSRRISAGRTTATALQQGGDSELEGSLRQLELLMHPRARETRAENLGHRLREAVTRADALRRPDLLRHALYLLANLHFDQGDFDAAQQNTLRAAAAARQADPTTLARALGDTARCLALLEREPEKAERLAAEAFALSAGVEEPLHEPDMAFGLIRRHQGRYEEALGHFDAAVEAIRESEDDWWESSCLLWKLIVQLEREEPADALIAAGELKHATWRREQAPEALFARGLREIARAQVAETLDRGLIDDLARALRASDSLWMLGYLQLEAALLEHRTGERGQAVERAREALEAAAQVGRVNELARARSLLIHLGRETGGAAAAREELSALEAADLRSDRLSARARQAVRAAREIAAC